MAGVVEQFAHGHAKRLRDTCNRARLRVETLALGSRYRLREHSAACSYVRKAQAETLADCLDPFHRCDL